jgi:uncharacterized membrane protein YedE/YeeE
MRSAVNLLAGLIFGLGLLISGLANPAKVLNFLDLAGTFDPSLLFVMAPAVAVTFIGYRLVLRRDKPLLADRFALPAVKDIDARPRRRRWPVRHQLGSIGLLPGTGRHLASTPGKGDAYLRARHAGRHRAGAPHQALQPE